MRSRCWLGGPAKSVLAQCRLAHRRTRPPAARHRGSKCRANSQPWFLQQPYQPPSQRSARQPPQRPSWSGGFAKRLESESDCSSHMPPAQPQALTSTLCLLACSVLVHHVLVDVGRGRGCVVRRRGRAFGARGEASGYSLAAEAPPVELLGARLHQGALQVVDSLHGALVLVHDRGIPRRTLERTSMIFNQSPHAERGRRVRQHENTCLRIQRGDLDSPGWSSRSPGSHCWNTLRPAWWGCRSFGQGVGENVAGVFHSKVPQTPRNNSSRMANIRSRRVAVTPWYSSPSAQPLSQDPIA